MSRITVTIGTPHGRDLTPEYVNSLFRSVGNGSGIAYKLVLREGLYVHHSRNHLLKTLDTDYLMFIDSDMFFQPGSIEKLISQDKPVIGGVYLRRLPPYVPLVFMIGDSMIPDFIDPVPAESFHCDGIGTGFMLIRRDVAERLAKYRNPFNFIPIPGTDKDLGEDLSFCYQLKQEGIELWADPTLQLGHISHHVVMMDRTPTTPGLVDIDGNKVSEAANE